MHFPKIKHSRGFTISEVLLVVVILGVLLALAFPVLNSISARSSLASCISNQRQLAVAMGIYIGEHQGEWPYPADERSVTPLGTWISRVLKADGKYVGMGQLFPYARDKRLFVCPADKARMNLVKQAGGYDREDGNFPASYVTRGFNQSAFPALPNLKKTAQMGRRAINSCQFAYAASNPKSFPLSWHKGDYPVLFSDGSVQVIRWPDGAVNLQRPPDINNSTALQIRVWDFFDGNRTTLSL